MILKIMSNIRHQEKSPTKIPGKTKDKTTPVTPTTILPISKIHFPKSNPVLKILLSPVFKIQIPRSNPVLKLQASINSKKNPQLKFLERPMTKLRR